MKTIRNTIGTIIVLLVLGGCEKETMADVYNDIDIKFDKSSLLADGYSSTKVTVTFGEKKLHPDQKVKFYTSQGKLFAPPFDLSSADGDSVVEFAPFSDTAELILQADRSVESEVFFSVDVNGHVVENTIRFRAAHPEDMMIEVDDQYLSPNEASRISVGFFRTYGKVSDKLKIFINDSIWGQDTTFTELILKYPEFVFTSDGQLTFEVGTLQHEVGAMARMYISVENERGEVLEKSVDLSFVD